MTTSDLAMYVVDELDAVSELPGVPPSSVGAPLPVVLADEDRVVLAYLGEPLPSVAGAPVIHVVPPGAQRETTVLVRFERHAAYYHGRPNDEAFAGHPLAERGLRPYGAFEVRGSSWIRSLERMSRVHERHRPERYWRLRHFVFAFHDSTFECVAEAYAISVRPGAPAEALTEMARQLGYGAPAG